MIKKIQIHLVMHFFLHNYDDAPLMLDLFQLELRNLYELYVEVDYVLMLEQMVIFYDYSNS